MAVDARIPLGTQVAQVPNLDIARPLLTMAQLRRLQTEQTLAESQLAEQQRLHGERATMRVIFRRNVQPDPQTGQPTMNKMGAIGEMFQVNPEMAMQMQERERVSNLALAKEQREEQKLKWEELKQKNAVVSNVVQWVLQQDTQDAKDAGVAHLESLGIQVDPKFKGVYDRKGLEQFLGFAQDNDARISQALKQAQLAETQQNIRMAPQKFEADEAHREASLAMQRRGQDVAAGAQQRAAATQAAGQVRAQEIAINRYLTPEEAGKLGVPIGTRMNQLAAQGIVPPPATEGQGLSLGFGMRAQEAHKQAQAIEQTTDVTGLAQKGLSAVPVIGNLLTPEALQQYNTAKLNFITAVLRKESGAAIQPTEYANEDKKYFPQPGDTKKTIQQKANFRQQAIQALETQAGRDLPAPTGGSASVAAPAAAAPPQALDPATLTPADLEALTPAQLQQLREQMQGGR